jgi:beta-glucanase (GH16 family)
MISSAIIKPASVCLLVSLMTIHCTTNHKERKPDVKQDNYDSCTIIVQAEDYLDSKSGDAVKFFEKDNGYVKTTRGGWLEYKFNVTTAGRYSVILFARTTDSLKTTGWIEDYAHNKDGRTYNITGSMEIPKASGSEKLKMVKRDGAPLDSGIHVIRFHYDSGAVMIDKICFDLIRPHKKSPVVLTQNTMGKNWKLVWSDEFNGEGLPDTVKWLFDVGNWGWGNNELQYYTVGRVENARQENGNLIIEARKNDDGHQWTSARLTTRSKESFLYGRIEFRGKVPSGRGTWSAGWLLGDDYTDELSWPYCGEVDVLENVGYEMNQETGNGKTHASVHCGAYYFKLGNQPTSIIDVKNMTDTFHLYTVDWLKDRITILIDGKKYFEYHDASDNLTWPFDKPQNLIINMAIGGGWGGAKGVDPDLTSAKFILDYVRVYELK